MSRYRAILLDVDGTLVDSNDLHAESWREILARHGIDVPFARVRRLIGMGGDKLLPELTGINDDSPEGERITKERGELFKQRYLAKARPLPGARQLVEQLKRDHALVVATSAKKEELQGLLKQGGVDDLLQEQTSSDDAEHSKPDPDIVQAALDKAHVAPHQALMLGDTPYDVAAAGRAGVPIVAFRCGGWDDAALTGALAVYDDPADLLQRLASSPLA